METTTMQEQFNGVMVGAEVDAAMIHFSFTRNGKTYDGRDTRNQDASNQDELRRAINLGAAEVNRVLSAEQEAMPQQPVGNPLEQPIPGDPSGSTHPAAE